MVNNINQNTRTDSDTQDNSNLKPNPNIITAYNPATNQLIGEVPCATPKQVEAAMERSRKAQPTWVALSLTERLRFLRETQRAFYRHYDELAATIVSEQGKSYQDAITELLPSLEMFSYYIRIAKKTLKTRRPFAKLVPHRRHRIEHRPHGVVLVISPWNFPVLLSITPIIAALAAGNTVILKPSEYATQISELILQCFKEANLPEGVFQVVHGYGDVGSGLIDARPDKICFTGSEKIGRKIAAKAGEYLIPVTLELGGKDAAIVLEDANIKRTARGLVWAGTINAGQACLSIERVYVVRSVADQLIKAMQDVMDRYVYPGPGDQPRSTYGAITTEAQMNVIEHQVADAEEHKAEIITGKNKPPQDGRFYLPTLITNLPNDAAMNTEETFGPIISIIAVDDEEEAIERANNTRFGLTASVWTENKSRGLRIARQMHTGVASVNEHIWSASTPEMPWGGVKASGNGRTRSIEGLLEMTVTQSLSYERFRLPFEPFWIPYTSLKRTLLNRFIHFWYGPTWRDKLKAFWR